LSWHPDRKITILSYSAVRVTGEHSIGRRKSAQPPRAQKDGQGESPACPQRPPRPLQKSRVHSRVWPRHGGRAPARLRMRQNPPPGTRNHVRSESGPARSRASLNGAPAGWHDPAKAASRQRRIPQAPVPGRPACAPFPYEGAAGYPHGSGPAIPAASGDRISCVNPCRAKLDSAG